MKSERRHELEKNELADWLGGVIRQIQPYQNVLLGTLAFALIVILIYAWSARYSAARTAEGWTEFSEALAPGAGGAHFEDIIDEYPNSEVGHWAAVVAGDSYLSSGCSQLLVNKADAVRDLKRAVDHYMNVLENSREPMIRERATYGLARARESMATDEEDLAEAAEEYEKLVKNWPDGAFAEKARRRLERINSGAAPEVYEMLAAYDPRPAFTDEPGTPGQRPAFDIDTLSDDAPMEMPSVDLDGPSSVVPSLDFEPDDGEESAPDEDSAGDSVDDAPTAEQPGETEPGPGRSETDSVDKVEE